MLRYSLNVTGWFGFKCYRKIDAFFVMRYICNALFTSLQFNIENIN